MKATTLKSVLGSRPGEDDFCSLETKHDRRREQKQNCFGEEITVTKVTNLKTVLGSSLDEDVEFRDNNNYNNNFFCDIQ
jgi:hypothetical protein